MRGVNKVMIEELTEEQISAARKRRAGDRRKANRDKRKEGENCGHSSYC